MKIVVIGAGLAGMAAARKLQQAGAEVEIYEASDRVAGRACTIRKPGTDDKADVGTQYFHTNYRRALKLIDDCGLRGELRKISGFTRFFDDRVSAGTFRVNHRFPYIPVGSPWANLKQVVTGGLRMLLNPIDPYAIPSGLKIDAVPVGERVRDPLEWEFNVRTLVAAGALTEIDQTSMSYLQLIRLMRIILMTNYLCLDNGIASLHQKLAAQLTIHLRAPVSSLVMAEGRVVGVLLADGRRIEADAVICATTPAAAANLLPGDWRDEAAFLNGVNQPPAQIVSLFLDRPLEAKVWSYVFRPDPEKIVSFCTDSAQKNPAMVPSGNAVLQAWICAPASARFDTAADQDVVDAAVAELSNHFPALREQIVHSHVHRVDRAIPQFPPDQVAAATAFLADADKRPGIEFCGDYLSGGYMECALWSADRACARLMAAMKA